MIIWPQSFCCVPEQGRATEYHNMACCLVFLPGVRRLWLVFLSV